MKYRIWIAIAVAVFAVAISLPSMINAAAPTSAPQLPITPLTWLPIAISGVLLVAVIAGIVYMLSGLIGSSNAKTWSRMQVYEALMSVVLILAFGFFSFIFFLSPQSAFGSLNLVPSACGTGSPNPATDIFTLASCDLATFNNASFSMASFLFYASYASGIIPGISVSISPIPTQPGIGASFTIPTLSPIPVSVDNLMKTGYDAFLFMMLLNQIQLILISASLIFLAIFMSIGLIVRTFGVSRSFGGSMIAFGLGLGLVYPLLVSITYGFIDVNSPLTCLALTNVGSCVNSVIPSMLAFLAGLVGIPTAGLLGNTTPFILSIGYIIAGFTFIPFLNFTILNAFIVDFSRAVGEQMDFMSLLGQVI